MKHESLSTKAFDMSLMAKLAVKPLLIACLVLVAMLGASSLYAYKLRSDVATAQAAVSVLEGERDTARADRDAAAARATEIANARDGWASIAGERAGLLGACQAENLRIRVAGDTAVANARAAARDAERTLGAFTRTYQIESRKPDCERARNAMAAACPALKDY